MVEAVDAEAEMKMESVRVGGEWHRRGGGGTKRGRGSGVCDDCRSDGGQQQRWVVTRAPWLGWTLLQVWAV